MTLSVVIATMNRSQDLRAALESLVLQTRMPDEIWIIDQSVDDASKKVLEEIQREHKELAAIFRYVFQETPSLVKARNRGLGLVTGDIVSFLDDDVVMDRDYYEKILPEFEADPMLLGLSGNARLREKFSGFKWEVRRLIYRFFMLSFYDGRMTPSGFGYPVFEREIEKPIPVDMLPGCNMNFRLSALQGETFDEFFKGYSYREDAEFSYRVSRKGRVKMIPDARLWHNYSMSSRLTEVQLKPMAIDNYFYVAKKFRSHSPFWKGLFAYSMLGIILIDLIEYLQGCTPQKRDKLNAAVRAARDVLRKG